MKNKSGIIVLIVFLLMFFSPFLGILFGEEGLLDLGEITSTDYARITDVDYKAVVVDEPNSEGKVVVTERITFDVHALSKDNPFWELWRDLCEEETDGVRVHYKVNSVKQVLPNGEKVTWAESPELYWDDYDYVSTNTRLGPGKWYHSEGPYNEYMEQYECVFFYVDGIYRDEITFEIEYEMYNAVLRYGDCADLYLPMYSGNLLKHLNSFKGEILIPNADMPKEGDYKVTTYGTKNCGFPIDKSNTKNEGYTTFSFDLDEKDLKFNLYTNFLEFELTAFGEDKHKFADYASINYFYNDVALEEIYDEQAYYEEMPQRHKQARETMFGICLFATGLFALIGIIKLIKTKKYSSYNAQEDKENTFRDIPSDLDPKFAAAIVASKEKKPENDAGVYASLLLSLARKKYISLEERGSDVIITINDPEIKQPTYESISQENVVRESPNNADITLEDNFPFHRQYEEQKTTTTTYDSPYNRGRVYEPSYERIYKPSYENPYDTAASARREQLYRGVKVYEDEVHNESYDIENNAITNEEIEYETREPLTVCEEHYLNLLRRNAPAKKISMETLQRRISVDYDYMYSFERKISQSIVDYGINLGYFQKANYLQPKKSLKASGKFFITMGILSITLFNAIATLTPAGLMNGGLTIFGAVCILFGILMNKQANKCVLYTELGEREYRKWKGLYNFLKSDTLMNERTVIELPLWEKYLVYATAFGISEKVIQAIKIRCPQLQTDSIVHHSYCRSGRFHSHSRAFHHSVRRGSHGFHSGGGYGGGGRGGGSGGGGH